MRKRIQASFSTAILLAALLVISACGNSGLRDNSETKQALGREFITELIEEILPYRERPEDLPEKGLVVAQENKTKELALVYQFYDAYKNGDECQLTTAFYSQNQLVIVRLVFLSKYEGYYYRYKLMDGPVEVTSKPMNGMELQEEEEFDKIILTIKQNKKGIASFTFYDDKEKD